QRIVVTAVVETDDGAVVTGDIPGHTDARRERGRLQHGAPLGHGTTIEVEANPSIDGQPIVDRPVVLRVEAAPLACGRNDVTGPEIYFLRGAAVVVIEPATGIAVLVDDLRALELEPELELVALARKVVRVPRHCGRGHVPVSVCAVVVGRVDRVVAIFVPARVRSGPRVRGRRLERVIAHVPAVANLEQG